MVTKEQLQTLPEVAIIFTAKQLGVDDYMELEKSELIEILLHHPKQTELQEIYDEHIEIENMID